MNRATKMIQQCKLSRATEAMFPRITRQPAGFKHLQSNVSSEPQHGKLRYVLAPSASMGQWRFV